MAHSGCRCAPRSAALLPIEKVQNRGETNQNMKKLVWKRERHLLNSAVKGLSPSAVKTALFAASVVSGGLFFVVLYCLFCFSFVPCVCTLPYIPKCGKKNPARVRAPDKQWKKRILPADCLVVPFLLDISLRLHASKLEKYNYIYEYT